MEMNAEAAFVYRLLLTRKVAVPFCGRSTIQCLPDSRCSTRICMRGTDLMIAGGG